MDREWPGLYLSTKGIQNRGEKILSILTPSKGGVFTIDSHGLAKLNPSIKGLSIAQCYTPFSGS